MAKPRSSSTCSALGGCRRICNASLSESCACSMLRRLSKTFPFRRRTGSRNFEGIGPGNGAFGSTINGEYVSPGVRVTRMKSKLSITTEGKMAHSIDPVHPGEILLIEFLEPLGITQYRLAKE